MERNDYTDKCLRTWLNDPPLDAEEVQILHACATLVDEWNEFREMFSKRSKVDKAELIDELGDVYYGCAILQHLTSYSHLPESDWYRMSVDHLDARIMRAHDLGTKILRSSVLDYYDRDDLDRRMESVANAIGEGLASMCKEVGVSVDTVLARNIAKLEKRHG